MYTKLPLLEGGTEMEKCCGCFPTVTGLKVLGGLFMLEAVSWLIITIVWASSDAVTMLSAMGITLIQWPIIMFILAVVKSVIFG